MMTLRERREKGRGGRRLREQSPTQGPEQLPCKQGEQHQTCLSGHGQELPVHTYCLPPSLLCSHFVPHRESRISQYFPQALVCPSTSAAALHMAGWRFACLEVEQNFIFEHPQLNRALPRRKRKMQSEKPGISC